MMGTLRQAWSDLQNHGFRCAVHATTYRILKRCAQYQVLKGMIITQVPSEYREGPEKYRYQFLDGEALRHFARDPQYDMTESFVAEARAKGDECYAILDGDRLASYGWYSHVPTQVADGLVLHFSSDYVYMYKGYTHPKYRGQRLHAIGMTRALQAYLERGFRGLISYVESNNYSSLKSVYRMGYVDIGRVYAARAAGRFWTVHTPGCRAYAFRLRAEPTATAQAAIKTAETQGMEPLVEPTIGRWFTAPFREKRKDVVDTVRAMIRNTKPQGYAGCCHAIAALDLTDKLPAIKIPTLIVVGEEDQGTPVAASQAIQAKIAGSELQVLKSAAHLSNMEQPEAFTAALTSFLSRVG